MIEINLKDEVYYFYASDILYVNSYRGPLGDFNIDIYFKNDKEGIFLEFDRDKEDDYFHYKKLLKLKMKEWLE